MQPHWPQRADVSHRDQGDLGRIGAMGRWLHDDAPKLLTGAGLTIVDMVDGVPGSDAHPGVHALYVRAPHVVTARVLDRFPDLRVIGVAGAGTEIVDLDAATAHGIPVIHGRGHGASAVAEWTVGAVLWLVRDVARLDRAVAAGQWAVRHETDSRRDLGALVVGICGYGHIGELVARAVTAGFGGTVVVCEPDEVRAAAARNADLAIVDLEDLLSRADVVTVHATARFGDGPLLGRPELQRLRSTAVVVNTSRGQLIDLDALADLLDEGRLAGAALDVFDPEPPDRRLVARLAAHRSVLLSPHASGMTADAVRALARGVATEIVLTLQGQRPQRCANPEVWT